MILIIDKLKKKPFMQIKNIESINIELPDNTEKLNNIEKYIKTLNSRFKLLVNNNEFSKKKYEIIHDLIVETLIMLGDLSLPALDVVDELEKKYILAYPNSPKLAKKLWLDHIDKINHRYDLLKNRCYFLIDDLEEEIIRLKIKKI
jgi:hypothetical protein